MPTHLRALKILGITLALVMACAFGGEPAKPEPAKVLYKPQSTRPFKDIPEVLFYEGFEHAVTWIDSGKVTALESAQGGHALKLEPAEWGKNDHVTWMQGHFARTDLKIPAGIKPAEITVQAAVYCDEPGEVTFKFVHANGDYAGHAPVPKAKTWGFVTIKLSDVRNDKSRPDAEQLIDIFEIHVKPPKSRKETPTAYIDDILVTLNARPEDVKARVLAADKKRIEIERFPEHDGFAWSMQNNDNLKEQFKAQKIVRKKGKDVLVAGATPEQSENWARSLAAAAAKTPVAGYTFHAAREPGTNAKALGGLPDMRLFLLSNLQKDEAFTMLFIGLDEALAPGRPADAVRVAIERALSMGSVTAVVVPAPEKPEQLEALAAFTKSIQESCKKLNVLFIDASHLLPNVSGKPDPKKLAPVPPDKLAELAVAALKHCYSSLAKD